MDKVGLAWEVELLRDVDGKRGAGCSPTGVGGRAPGVSGGLWYLRALFSEAQDGVGPSGNDISI